MVIKMMPIKDTESEFVMLQRNYPDLYLETFLDDIASSRKSTSLTVGKSRNRFKAKIKV